MEFQVLSENQLWNEELVNDIPKHWEKHDDLIIFPINCFQNPIWSNFPNNSEAAGLWQKVWVSIRLLIVGLFQNYLDVRLICVGKIFGIKRHRK